MILSKYDSDADVYQYYNFVNEDVTYGKLHIEARKQKHIRTWTHTLDELGWKNRDRYIAHLKNKGYREVKKYERMVTPQTAAV